MTLYPGDKIRIWTDKATGCTMMKITRPQRRFDWSPVEELTMLAHPHKEMPVNLEYEVRGVNEFTGEPR